jgi:hypothetical protein
MGSTFAGVHVRGAPVEALEQAAIVWLEGLVTVTPVPAGALVTAAVADPFALTDAHRAALEEPLLDCVGHGKKTAP